MDLLSNFFAHLSELFMTSSNTGVTHIDILKLSLICLISVMTYGIVLMRKINITQKENRKDEAETALYNSLKEQIDFLSKQVKEQAETLKITMQQKETLFKEFTELRLKTNLLQEEVNKLKNVKVENDILKTRLNEKDNKIKMLRDKHDEMVNTLINELKLKNVDSKK